MTITLGGATTNFQSAAAAPTVQVPSGAAVGDRLYAWVTYGSGEAVTPPSGWTELVGGAAGSSYYSLIYRNMASGVTSATWTTSAVGPNGGYGKSVTDMVVVKGGASHAVGSPAVRTTSDTATVIGSVTVPTGGLLLAFAGDKLTSSATAPQTVTAPSGMTEQAKYVYVGGGGVSALIASQFPAAGASGTRTVTYGLANTNAVGVLLAITPATGTLPVVSAGGDKTITLGASQPLQGSSTGTSNQWALVSGPAGASAPITNASSATNASVAPNAPGIYVLRLTGNNSDGTTSDTMTLTVTAASARPSGVVSNPGGFVAVGADTIEGALADGLDTSWIELDATSGDAITVQVTPVTSGSGSTYSYTVKARTSIAPVDTGVFTLMQGATVIATHTQQLTTSFVNYTFTFTSESTGVTNWADLRVKIAAQ